MPPASAQAMTLSDQTLIQRTLTQRGTHAYAQLVRRYQSSIRYSLQQWCRGDFSLAEDLAQETFLKAYQALPRFHGGAQFRTWLYKIAYNTWVSHLRKSRTQPVAQTFTKGEPGADTRRAHPVLDRATEATHSASPQQSLESTDIQRDIATAMAQLSYAQRTAIHLCLQRGFSHQEASDIMNIPLGTVKTHLLRGRQKLQALLKPWHGEVVHEA